ncbi:PREDICTED: p53-induced death domain-containing protein 1-like [Branchiostoma belcheri]|uniref:P53-induced death domain-containing protein 1-like n=1 Tax=Branchiostoma belcheri TaxID=7741 RepID=A0A6P5APC1_BRABE|nr:PREDICTED: p53-induced death domain-containing protein 1-like [Branchiostoma belcheri]
MFLQAKWELAADLCLAAGDGDEEKVTELIRQGADVNYDSADGETPEDIAARTDTTDWYFKDRVLEGRKKILELFAAVKAGRPFTYKLKVGPEGGKLQTAYCTVSVPRGAVTMATEITCQVINPNDVTLPLKDGEMLVSDIIELGPHGTTFRKPVTVQMQYNCASPSGATETVVWVSEDRSQWKELETSKKGEDRVAVSVDHFSIFAVISQPKQDKFTVHTEGFKLTSSTQPAVQISFPEQTVNTPTQVTVQVQEVPKRAVEDTKAKDESFGNLVGTSPIVNVTTESKSDVRIHKPVTVRVPHPQHYMDIQHERPTKLRVMSCEEGTEDWKDVTENTNPQESFEFVEFKVSHFARWIVIVVTDITGDTELEPIPLNLCRWLQLRPVQFIMLQSGDDANRFVVECAKAEDAEEKHSALLQKGYKGPLPTNSAIDLFEGQVVEMALLGNVSIPAFGSSTNQQITFHSQRGSRLQMHIMALKAKDQQSLDGRGFAEFFALPRVKVQKEEVDKQEGGLEDLVQKGREVVKHPPGNKLHERTSLCQLPIHVPFETQVEQHLYVEKFFYFTKEEVSTDWKDLAITLGLNWATYSNIAGRNPDDKSRCMDMLQEWKKKKGDAATIEVLMEALSKAELQSVVDGLKREFPDIVAKKP